MPVKQGDSSPEEKIEKPKHDGSPRAKSTADDDLARAIKLAADAGEWGVVETLARLMAAREKAPTLALVATPADEKSTRGD